MYVFLTTQCTAYSGTTVMWTPLGPTRRVLIKGVSLFEGLFNIHKILLGPRAVSALQWMSIFQWCPQGGVPLYTKYGKLLLKN